MPPGRRGSSGDTYINLAAFILDANSARPGDRTLTADSDASIRSVASGERAAYLQRLPPLSLLNRPIRTSRTAGAASASWNHGGGRSQELRSGHRRHAAQSRSRRLADDSPRLQGHLLQPAEPDHRAERERPASGVELGHAGRREQREPARAHRAQRRAVREQRRHGAAGSGRQDRRADLGESLRLRQSHRPRHARHRDLRRQDFRSHGRGASDGLRRPQRQGGLGHDHRRPLEGRVLRHQRTAGGEGQADSGTRPRFLRRVSRREMLHQRLRRQDRQRSVALSNRGARRRTRRRYLGRAREHLSGGRGNVDHRQLRSGFEPHLLGDGASQAVDAREPRLRQRRDAVCQLHAWR